MTIRTRVIGWLILGISFALWPPLIAASFAYMPQPLAALSGIAHGASFIFIGLLGVYLLLPDRRPFDTPLPQRPEELFGRTTRDEGEVILAERGTTTGGSDGVGTTIPSPSSTTYTTGGTRAIAEDGRE